MSRLVVAFVLVLALPLSAIALGPPTEGAFQAPIDGGRAVKATAIAAGRDFHFIGVFGLSHAVVGGLSGQLTHNGVTGFEPDRLLEVPAIFLDAGDDHQAPGSLARSF